MRTARLRLIYNNKDISRDIAEHVLEATHDDNASGQADDLQVMLEDREDLWKTGWFPAKGATLKADFICDDWPNSGAIVYSAGVFTIDEVEFSGPPDTVTIKAASASVTSSLRREKKTRAWEDCLLESIGQTIVQGTDMGFYYSSPAPVHFKRVDQREESDLAFLKRLCDSHGLNCKTAVKKIVIYSGQTFDAMPPVASISRKGGSVSSFRFSTKSSEVYRACQVAYWNPDKKAEEVYVFEPPQAPASGQVLKINERIEGLDAAVTRAKTELRKKNKAEVTGDISCYGLPHVKSGLNISVAGYGRFDGVYAVDKATHKIVKSGGYTTSLAVRNVLPY